MKLIDKDVAVAELEKIIADETENIKTFEHSKNVSEVQRSNARMSVLMYIHSFLDTLEAKEVDFENSMVCKVGWYDGLLLDYTQEQQDDLLKKIGADVGDKIRVILIKE